MTTAEMDSDLKRLKQFSFYRQRKCEPLLMEVHRLINNDELQADRKWLLLLKAWLLTPYSLWPSDFIGFGEHLCKKLQEQKKLDEQHIAILRKFQKLPSESAMLIVCENEVGVAKGDYDRFLTKTAQAKFKLAEKDLLNDPEWFRDWADFKGRHDVAKYRGERSTVLRRTRVEERNFHPEEWLFKGVDPEELFWLELDALCFKWDLYGVEIDKPLLMKLSVNPTAQGLMIYIPSYWSLDYKRDLNWTEITKLQKSRGQLRQGKTMSDKRARRHELARRVYAGFEDARRLKLTGADKLTHVARFAGLELDIDERILRRLRNLGRQLVKGNKTRTA